MQYNEEVRSELLHSVSALTDSQLNEKQSDKWSIMQVLEHLYLMEQSIVEKMSSAMASDVQTSIYDKPIHLTVNRNHKVIAPPFVTPSDTFITLAAIKEKLQQSRTAFELFLADIDQEKSLKRSFPHPVFGPLQVKQWIEFISLHEKRHLGQIEELKMELGIVQN